MRSILSNSVFYLIGWLARIVLTLLLMSCRVSVYGQEIEKNYLMQNPGRGLLYASWHRGLFFFVYFYRFLNFIVMASASKDGELAAQATRRFGWIPVRGSSSKRGSEALSEMQTLVMQGYRGGLVVDAPKGPPFISKIGIIVLAKRTNLPILPVMWSADRYWMLRSWDRTIIPKPFSRIVFVYNNDFLIVPQDASQDDCELKRIELDRVLNRLLYQTDQYFRSGADRDPRTIAVPED